MGFGAATCSSVWSAHLRMDPLASTRTTAPGWPMSPCPRRRARASNAVVARRQLPPWAPRPTAHQRCSARQGRRRRSRISRRAPPHRSMVNHTGDNERAPWQPSPEVLECYHHYYQPNSRSATRCCGSIARVEAGVSRNPHRPEASARETGWPHGRGRQHARRVVVYNGTACEGAVAKNGCKQPSLSVATAPSFAATVRAAQGR